MAERIYAATNQNAQKWRHELLLFQMTTLGTHFAQNNIRTSSLWLPYFVNLKTEKGEYEMTTLV